MESVAKRGRGRPKNSGKDDSEALRQVAALMAEKPGMGPWTAVSAVVRQMPDDVLRAANVKRESVAHRLNVKWRGCAEALLAAARRAREEQIAAKRRADAQAVRRQYAETMSAIAESAALVAARAVPVMTALEAGLQRTFASSQVQGALAAMAEFQASPAMRQVAEVFANLDLHRVEIPKSVFEMASAQATATGMLAHLDMPHLATSRALLEQIDMSATAEAARQLRHFA